MHIYLDWSQVNSIRTSNLDKIRKAVLGTFKVNKAKYMYILKS